MSTIAAGRLPEDASRKAMPKGAVTGFSDRKERPPIGRHRYFQLDATLHDKPLTKAELEAAIKGHVLAEASLKAPTKKAIRKRTPDAPPLTAACRLA